jgi:2-desacetyl-2-hydroxyethyl bacteriochlorophyllide A dehydrogenase
VTSNKDKTNASKRSSLKAESRQCRSSLVGRERAISVVSRSLWFIAPRTVGILETTLRPPLQDEVRIRALYSGISQGTERLVYCGEVTTDLPLDSTIPTIEGSFAFPIKYGYSSVGLVREAGPGIKGLREGDLVFAFNPHETEYVIPAQFVLKLPDGIEPNEGVFFPSIETAINVMLDAAPRIGERIVIFGQGVVGLLITQLAARMGASLIATIEPVKKRRALSLALGADFAVDPITENATARILEATGGAGADVVIEASGQPAALDEAVKVAATESRVTVVSWYGTNRTPLALGDVFHRNRITIKSSQVSNLDPALSPRWTARRRQELALSYLGKLNLEGLITHTFPFDDAAAAYRLVDERSEDALQIIFDYGLPGC